MKTQVIEDKKIFAGSSRLSIPRNDACALQMTGMWRVRIDGDGYVSWVSLGEALPIRHSQNTTISILSWLFAFQSFAGHMNHFVACLLASYPRKHFSLQFVLSLHTSSLSHTTFTNKTHMKYRVQNIEHNYNQIWHGIKANRTHSCKLQLYKIG